MGGVAVLLARGLPLTSGSRLSVPPIQRDKHARKQRQTLTRQRRRLDRHHVPGVRHTRPRSHLRRGGRRVRRLRHGALRLVDRNDPHAHGHHARHRHGPARPTAGQRIPPDRSRARHGRNGHRRAVRQHGGASTASGRRLQVPARRPPRNGVLRGS